MNRREFLRAAAAIGLTSSRGAAEVLEPWRPGTLDIHHLAYGRGNSTFFLGPDGTTMLLDAGTTEDSLEVSSAQKPNAAMRPGQWIASYLSRQMDPAARREIDYALVTHIHPDHVGDVGAENPPSPDGTYRLTGLTDVAARIGIGTVIDRGFPDYSYPLPQRAPFALNYLSWMKSRVRSGETCERFRVGSPKQVRMVRERGQYAGFEVRIIAANGEVWTGPEDQTRRLFPKLETLREDDYPTENMCSAAIRVSYGKFRYFTGGDLTCDTEESGEEWRDIETPVARAAGPVTVAVANHHAYFDAVGPNFVRLLRPRVFIVPAWYVAHPSVLPLRRMLSRRLYPGDRDVFATTVMAANRVVNNQFIGALKSVEGHVIVRVAPGGEEFRVMVCENADDTGRVKSVFGPYRCERGSERGIY